MRLRLALLALVVACGAGDGARVERAVALQAEGRFGESIPLLREALEAEPERPDANYRLALALLQEDAPLEAAWPLQLGASAPATEIEAGIALASGPLSPRAAIGAARLLLAMERGELALRFAQAASPRAQGADGAEARIVEIHVLTALDRFDEARAALEPLEQAAGPAIAARERAILAGAELGPGAAVASLQGSDLDLTAPENRPALIQLADELRELGMIPEALEPVDAALARSPEDAVLLELRGHVALFDRRRWGPAREAFEQALALDPERPRALAGMAVIVANERNFAEAIALLDRAHALDPAAGSYPYLAVQMAMAAGRRDEAMRRLRQIVRQYPANTDAMNDLAWYLAEDGEDLDLALSLAQRARERKESANVLDTLGWVHHERGETSLAVAALEEAHALSPRSQGIRYRLGVALAEGGETERARAMLRSSLAQGDRFGEAAAARAALAALDTESKP